MREVPRPPAAKLKAAKDLVAELDLKEEERASLEQSFEEVTRDTEQTIVAAGRIRRFINGAGKRFEDLVTKVVINLATEAMASFAAAACSRSSLALCKWSRSVCTSVSNMVLPSAETASAATASSIRNRDESRTTSVNSWRTNLSARSACSRMNPGSICGARS